MNMRRENAMNKSGKHETDEATRDKDEVSNGASDGENTPRRLNRKPLQEAIRLQSASLAWGSKQGSRSWSLRGLMVHTWTGRGSGGSSKKRSIKPA